MSDSTPPWAKSGTTSQSWLERFDRSLPKHFEDSSLSKSLEAGINGHCDPEQPDPLHTLGLRMLGHILLYRAGTALERLAPGSPIEQAILLALTAAGHERGCDVFWEGCDSSGWDCRADLSSGQPEALTITTQYPVGAYRVDFRVQYVDLWERHKVEERLGEEAAGNLRPAEILVECDGHDYHERTKEQARHDKKRDRALQELGFVVFHFTGSEIWADPIVCACQILDKLQKDYRKQAAQ